MASKYSSPLLIKNARVLDGGNAVNTDILIENCLITAFGEFQNPSIQTLDAKGRFVLPSFVDMHVHLRTPGYTHKETLRTGCGAALRGGYTALNAMANTDPVCSDAVLAEQIYMEAQRMNLCDVYQSVSMTRDFDGKTTSHLNALSDRYKAAVRCVSDDGRGIASGAVFLKALQKANKRGLLPLIHAEDAALSDIDMAAAEDQETLRDLQIIEEHGLRAHFCHVSTEVSARAIIEAKSRGANVSFEVTPHHIALNDKTTFSVNPPLRPESDRAFIANAAANGLVDTIATDHAPHTQNDKAQGAPGLVGLETSFCVCYTVLCKGMGIPLKCLSDMMSANPRRLLGLPEVRVAPGYPADLVVVDLDREHIINSADFKSKSRNTPFEGRPYQGEVTSTIKDGRIL